MTGPAEAQVGQFDECLGHVKPVRLVVNPCRSEPAREKPESTEVNQVARVIVGVHREQARSYSGSEFKGSSLGRHFNPLLPARADQLYLNFLGGREAGENIRQVQ
ncbi:hypothetical protein D3C72_1102240 [compost metagenome]